ncbi:MAG: L-lactate dehydrogenase [Ruminococcus sp.]|nr:L-lactate dehydrogenase [Ruminococcus sp.]
MKKIVLVGTGMVGMSFAYAALNQNLCDELVLCDINTKRAEGEAQDLNHGLAFSKTSMHIYAGDYSDCKDADIVVISAGVNQKPGETRLQLLQRNLEIFKTIVEPVVESGFDGIFLVATNPVDIMTRITRKLSGFQNSKVIGTGTTLDSARLRFLLGDYFRIDPRNIHGYVIGEHGDSEFVPWSQVTIGPKPVLDELMDNPEYKMSDLTQIEEEVRHAAYKIIEAKGATYYGIGMAICRVARAILQDENSILTVSSRLDGAYGLDKVYAGTPCIVNKHGADRRIELTLINNELKKFKESCELLDETFKSLSFEEKQ